MGRSERKEIRIDKEKRQRRYKRRERVKEWRNIEVIRGVGKGERKEVGKRVRRGAKEERKQVGKKKSNKAKDEDFGDWAIFHEVPLVEDRLQSCWLWRLMMAVTMIPICNKWHERPHGENCSEGRGGDDSTAEAHRDAERLVFIPQPFSIWCIIQCYKEKKVCLLQDLN